METGISVERAIELIEANARPVAAGHIRATRAQGRILSEDYEDTGTRVTVMLPQDAAGQIAARYSDMIQA